MSKKGILRAGKAVAAGIGLGYAGYASGVLHAHRELAHTSMRIEQPAKGTMRWLFWLTSGTDSRRFAVGHRNHHAHAETPLDPLSPNGRSMLRTIIESPRDRTNLEGQAAALAAIGKGVVYGPVEQDPLLVKDKQGFIEMTPHKLDVLLRNRPAALAALAIVSYGLFGKKRGPLFMAATMAVPFTASAILNGPGHDNPPGSDAIGTNGSTFGAAASLGERDQAHHHAFPREARSALPEHPDPGYRLAGMLQRLGQLQIIEASAPQTPAPQEDVLTV